MPSVLESSFTVATNTIAHVTDIHLGQKVFSQPSLSGNKMGYVLDPEEHKENLIAILDDLTRRGIREVVFGGDIGLKASIPWFFAALKRYDVHLRMFLGNHDTLESVRPYYPHPDSLNMGELYFACEGSHFKSIYLDSSSNSVSSEQSEWLRRELTSPKKILLFVHHPILALDTPLDRIGAALGNRDEIKACLQASGRSVMIFCGHYHMIDDRTDGTLRQYLTPAASYQIVKEASGVEIDQTTFGYRTITIVDDQLTTEVVSLRRCFGMHLQ
jgi:hypothetical protein